MPPAAEGPSETYTTQEKLLLAQAVHKYGAVAWPAVSKLLVQHPCVAGQGRPAQLFTPEGCEAGYIALMGEIGMNVPAEGAMKPHAKCHLRLAQTFYLARMNELKSAISAYEARFTTLFNEVQQLKSGQMDAPIRAELRGVLARKYGKRLLDAWMPDQDEVKAAVEAGPVSEAEKQAKEASDKRAEKQDKVVSPEKGRPEANEGEDDSEKTATPAMGPAASPAPSELSPPPSAVADSPAPAAAARSSKRKASTQPKGVPSSKRSGRRGVSSPVATPANSDGDIEPEPTSEGIEESKDVEEDEAPPSRGRRATKYSRKLQPQGSPAASAATKDSSPAISRRAPSVSSTTSATPAEDRRTSSRRGRPPKGLRDNVVSKAVREQTVESVKEEQADDDADEEEERPTRRSGRRGGKDGTASEDAEGDEGDEKPTRRSGRRGVKEETAEEDAEDDHATRRSGRRGTKGERMATPTPAEKDKRGKRGVKTAAPVSAERDGDNGEGKDDDEDDGTNTPTSAIPAHMSRERDRARRQSSPRDAKAAQKMLLALLDAVSGHRNGNVFLGPVKKSDAPDYYEIIKRPIDLKTIRQRIRDGQVLSIDEFERDVALMFANAMMYNSPDSQVYEMAEEMRGETESTIAHFRSMQHEMGRSQG